MIVEGGTTGLRVVFSTRASTSLALARARVPLVESVEVVNQTADTLAGLRLALSWEQEERAVALPALAPGEPFTLAGLEAPAPIRWLADQRAPVRTDALRWRVTAGDAVLAEGALGVEVRPADEWPGDDAPPPLLACFVPSGQVGSLAQPGDPLDVVWERIEALDFALDALVGGPRRGARVRSVEQLLAERSANAVERAVLFAACAERVGAGVVLVVSADRVLVGVDPEVSVAAQVATESRASLAARTALRLFDPTARGSLAAAERRAKGALDGRAFAFAVDLGAARASGWLPLLDAELPTDRAPRRPASQPTSAWRSELAAASAREPPALPLSVPSLDSLAARIADPESWTEVVSTGGGEDRLSTPLPDDERVARAVALERAEARFLTESGGGGCALALGLLRAPGGAVDVVAVVPVLIDVHRSARKVRFRGLGEPVAPNAELFYRLGILPPAPFSLAAAVSALAGRGEVSLAAALVARPPSVAAMIGDLERHGAEWQERPLVAALAAAEHAPLSAPDRDGSVRDFPLPLDADAAQVSAVGAAMLGRSFVLLGAPGTGKSQTLVNLAAAAAAAGQKVLVVSSSAAALDTVRRRLGDAGLDHGVLPLYGAEARPGAVLRRWAAAIDRPGSASPRGFDERAAELDVARKEVNGYVRAIHHRQRCGWSFYEANARLLAGRDLPVVPLGLADPLALTAEDLDALEGHAARFAVVGPAVEPVAEHPFADTHPPGAGPEVVEQVHQRLKRAFELLDQVAERAVEVAAALEVSLGDDLVTIDAQADAATLLGEGPFPAHALGLDADDPGVLAPGARTFRDEARAFRTEVNKWHEHARTVLQRWHPGVYRADDLERMVHRFEVWSRRPTWLAWWFLRRSRRALLTHARKGLPDNVTIASDLRSALAVESGRDALFRERRRLVASTGGGWETEDPEDAVELAERAEDALTKFRAAQAAGVALSDTLLGVLHPKSPADRRRLMKKRGADGTRAVERFRASWRALCDLLRPEALPADAPLDVYRARLDRWSRGAEQFGAWAEYHLSCSELAVSGLGAIVDLHRADSGPTVHAAEVPGLVERSVLKEWVAAARVADDTLRAFSGVERHRAVLRFRKLDEAWSQVSAGHVAHLLEQRRPSAERARESLRGATGPPIRERWALGGALHPIVLASPDAVAGLLPDGPLFELVLFDEANALSTAAAVGALARAGQMVVCGDDLQPSTAGSLLHDALSAGLPAHRLTWHHRSQHPDLVAFTRERLYRAGFDVLPAARSGPTQNGLHLHSVQGRFERRGAQTNPIEARLVVDHLIKSLLQTSPGDRTFGVVALDPPQAALIAQLVDDARRERPEIEGHFLGVPEPVLVGHPAAVRGQERDEVLVSVGFAADEDGTLPASFGSLAELGGERLLHVALTRARQVTRVFTGLAAAQLDRRHTWSRGVLDLRDFLGWCEARPVAPAVHPGPVEREVAAALHARGWDVAFGVGDTGYRVDLAVLYPERPGQYLLGVELDGPTYASARSARDRDRLRPKELERRGWRLHRIWSLDWALDKPRELRRLEQALDDALIGDNAPDESTEPMSAMIDDDDDEPTTVRVNPEVVTYEEAEPLTVTDQGSLLHDADLLPELKRVVQHVLDREAPIHLLELTRRVGAAFGVTKITARAQKRVLAVACALDARATVRGEFVWAAGQDRETYDRVRGPTVRGEAARLLEHIPPEEIAHAVRQVLASDGAEPALRSVALADIVRETARVFGIQRVGRRTSDGIGRGLQVLEARSEIVVQGERIVVLR